MCLQLSVKLSLCYVCLSLTLPLTSSLPTLTLHSHPPVLHYSPHHFKARTPLLSPSSTTSTPNTLPRLHYHLAIPPPSIFSATSLKTPKLPTSLLHHPPTRHFTCQSPHSSPSLWHSTTILPHFPPPHHHPHFSTSTTTTYIFIGLAVWS